MIIRSFSLSSALVSLNAKMVHACQVGPATAPATLNQPTSVTSDYFNCGCPHSYLFFFFSLHNERLTVAVSNRMESSFFRRVIRQHELNLAVRIHGAFPDTQVPAMDSPHSNEAPARDGKSSHHTCHAPISGMKGF